MQQSNKRAIFSTSQHHAPEYKHTKNQWQGLKLVPCTSRSTTKISGQVLSQHHAPYVPVKLQHRSHAKELASIQQCAPVAKSQQSSRSFQLKNTSNNVYQSILPIEEHQLCDESSRGVSIQVLVFVEHHCSASQFFQLKSTSSVTSQAAQC